LVPGTFNAACGNASQTAEHAHVHFCFPPEPGEVYTSDGYTLNLLSNNWTKGAETVAPLGYLTATWQDANVQPQSAVGANFYDELMKGWVPLAEAAAAPFPDHQSFNLAERVLGIAVIPLQMVYAVALVNFNMTIPFFVFGIISALEIARFAYSAWMWIKRAIPVIG
jgi:hypothetical protein